MIRNKLAIAAVALVGALGAGLAQARDDVRFSVTIGTPAPVYATGPAYVVGGPAYVAGHGYGYGNGYGQGYGHGQGYGYGDGYYRAPVQRATPWDRDGDGIPNRYDRVYRPRWDRDGDGIPNRYDRVYNPRWDRDGDGIPNRRDPHPYRYDGRADWHRY